MGRGADRHVMMRRAKTRSGSADMTGFGNPRQGSVRHGSAWQTAKGRGDMGPAKVTSG